MATSQPAPDRRWRVITGPLVVTSVLPLARAGRSPVRRRCLHPITRIDVRWNLGELVAMYPFISLRSMNYRKPRVGESYQEYRSLRLDRRQKQRLGLIL